jgi:hypothetical protein
MRGLLAGVGTELSQVVGAVVLGLVGLWLAHNYRRQIRIRLAERQTDAYARLWEATRVARADRTAPLTRAEREDLYQRMQAWYFDAGDGIFLSLAARNLYVAARTNLVCPPARVRPPRLAAELARLAPEDAERRRGCVSVQQMSLLRTQLKADLAMHYGYAYYSSLRRDDRDFLRSCGIHLWRRPWRRRPLRPPARLGPIPCVCGMCDLA